MNIDFSPEFVRLAVRGRHNKISRLFDMRVCVFNIFQDCRGSDCFNIQVIDIDVHICFKIDMIVIACLLVASGSVSLVS